MSATVTLLLRSGGAVVLARPFIFGNGVAGDIAGETRFFADSVIESIIEKP